MQLDNKKPENKNNISYTSATHKKQNTKKLLTAKAAHAQ